jgi:hypothetical protein
MFMNPNSMDATAREYWEFSCAKIMAQSMASRCGNDGGDGSRGGGDGGEQVVVGGGDGCYLVMAVMVAMLCFFVKLDRFGAF